MNMAEAGIHDLYIQVARIEVAVQNLSANFEQRMRDTLDLIKAEAIRRERLENEFAIFRTRILIYITSTAAVSGGAGFGLGNLVK